MYCVRCGAPLADGAAYCPMCGTPTQPGGTTYLDPNGTPYVGGTQPGQAPYTTDPNGSPYVGGTQPGQAPYTPQAPQPEPERPSSGRGKLVLVAVIAAVVAVALTAVVFVFLGSTDASDTATTDETTASADSSDAVDADSTSDDDATTDDSSDATTDSDASTTDDTSSQSSYSANPGYATADEAAAALGDALQTLYNATTTDELLAYGDAYLSIVPGSYADYLLSHYDLTEEEAWEFIVVGHWGADTLEETLADVMDFGWSDVSLELVAGEAMDSDELEDLAESTGIEAEAGYYPGGTLTWTYDDDGETYEDDAAGWFDAYYIIEVDGAWYVW